MGNLSSGYVSCFCDDPLAELVVACAGHTGDHIDHDGDSSPIAQALCSRTERAETRDCGE